MNRISSGRTFFMKRIFSVIWFGFIFIFLIATSVMPFVDRHGNPPPFPFQMFPVLMLIFGFVLFRKLLWGLADSVDDCGDYLLVRRGSEEFRLMLDNVLNVSMSQFVNPPRLTLRLRRPGPIGDEVAFIPRQEGIRLNPFARNQVAEDLMQRVDRLRTQPSQR